MEQTHNQFPLIISSSQIISSPTKFGTVKKRRLSEDSNSSNTSDKSLLEKKFLDLNLDCSSKNSSLDENTMRIEDSIPAVRPINIPKPIRRNPMQQEESSSKSENYFETLFRTNQSHLTGIAKYLTLDVESKIQDLQKLTNTTNTTEKFKISSILTSPLYNALAFPLMKDLYASSSQKPSESQESNNNTRKDSVDVFDPKLLLKENYVGKLTKAERQLKVEKFLEKKQNRKWKSIRYTVRKDLANSRKREQGRFVKSNNNVLSQSASSTKIKDKENQSAMITKKLQNNSDITFNNLSLSSSLGKRSGKPDLFVDAAASL